MQTELTLMVAPSRNLPIPKLRKHIELRMLEGLNILTNDKADVEDVQAVKQLCATVDGDASLLHQAHTSLRRMKWVASCLFCIPEPLCMLDSTAPQLYRDIGVALSKSTSPCFAAIVGDYLSESGFVKDNEILSGTNFIFTTTPQGALTAEGE